MKSPNASTSMKLLKTAEQAIRNAREDLKNDVEVRDAKVSVELESLADKLAVVQKVLKNMGYV